MWFKKKTSNDDLMIKKLNVDDLKTYHNKSKLPSNDKSLEDKLAEWNTKSLLKAENDAQLDALWINNYMHDSFGYLQKRGFIYSKEELLLRQNFLWFLDRFNVIVDYSPGILYQIMGDYDFFTNIDTWRMNAKIWYDSLILNEKDYESFLEQHTHFNNLNDHYVDFQKKPLVLDILKSNANLKDGNIVYTLEFFSALDLVLSEAEWNELVKEAKKLNHFTNNKQINFRIYVSRLVIKKLKELVFLLDNNFGSNWSIVKYLYEEKELEEIAPGVLKSDIIQLKHDAKIIIKDSDNNYYYTSFYALSKPFHKNDLKQLTKEEVKNISDTYDKNIVKLNQEGYKRFRIAQNQSVQDDISKMLK